MTLFRLNADRNPVSWVDSNSYPDIGGCHLVCLSDRQCAIIRDMVYPAATWRTRFCRRVYGQTFTAGDPTIRQEHLKEVDDLLYQIGGASNMACTELIQALVDLATALATASGGQTVVNCGSCGGSENPTAVATLAGCVGQLPAESLLPAEDIEEPSGYGEPPEGWDTWEEYRSYKCQAAHWVVDTLIASLRNFGVANLIGASLSLVSATVLGGLGALAGILAPPAFLAIVASLVQLELLASGAAQLLRQVSDNVAVHRSELICAMYKSGSAADAVELLNSALEDAVEGVVYGAAFEALAGPIGGLLGGLVASMVDMGVTRVMWQLTADVVYYGADCSTCDEETDMPWHFTNGADGWYWDDPTPESGWSYTSEAVIAETPDPYDEDAGALYTTITSPGSSDWYPSWRKDVEYLELTAETGKHLYCDLRTNSQVAADWRLTITYADDTSDQLWIRYSQVPTSWDEQSIAVTSGNNGKLIKAFSMCCRVSYNEGGTQQYWMDNIGYS